MKLFKLKSIDQNKMKRYVLYAIGEVFLVVIGILVALYINNTNAHNRYEKQIDSSFLRTYAELEDNILAAQSTIESLRVKDSLIHLVMHDSIRAEMYENNIELAYLILFFHNLNIEDKAYQNLISLNVSDSRYQEELLAKLKQLYAINENIKDVNKRMSSFVYDRSLPLMAERIESFGDLTYKGEIKQDVVDYQIGSEEYKSYVSQYAIIAIKNQLRHNQHFLKTANELQRAIAKDYDLHYENTASKDSLSMKYVGKYVNNTLSDTLSLSLSGDSLMLSRNKGFELSLTPITQQSYFTDHDKGGYFVTFYPNGEDKILKLNLLAIQYLYQKID
ncbi:MAG: hypothetical protein AAFO69_12425 [Bacteroidota bacterium]